MEKLTVAILFGVLALSASAEKPSGQPCVFGGIPGTEATTCAGMVYADLSATNATYAATVGCHDPTTMLDMTSETEMKGVRCYSPTLMWGICASGLHNYTVAVDFCTAITVDASDFRLPLTIAEAGAMCANGCGLDDKAIWFESNENMTSSPTMGPTATPTTDSPTVTTMSPSTVAPTTMSPTMSPTTASPTVSPTASPTGSPTVTTMSPTMSPTTMSPTMSPTTMSPTVNGTTMSPTVINTTAIPPAPTSGATAAFAANALALAATTLMMVLVFV